MTKLKGRWPMVGGCGWIQLALYDPLNPDAPVMYCGPVLPKCPAAIKLLNLYIEAYFQITSPLQEAVAVIGIFEVPAPNEAYQQTAIALLGVPFRDLLPPTQSQTLEQLEGPKGEIL
jgi:hypothetical protein